MSLKEKESRVEQVIMDLGLIQARDTVIGNEKHRGVSGGEKKRVNIGVDLLHDPKLIFCDEPTSGLDSFQAEKVMQTLKDLATKGHTVICSIHQPRSSIYAKLDTLLLLSQGRTLYYGKGGTAVTEYFSRLGHPVLEGYNPADFLLDLISVDSREGMLESSKNRVEKLAGVFQTSPEGIQINDAPREGRTELPSHMSAAGMETFWEPFMLLLARTWREQTRDKPTLVLKYTINFFFTAMFGIVYFRMPFDQTSFQNRTGILFFMAMNQAFGASISTSQVIPSQLKVVSRERASKLYGVFPYYLAVFLVNVPLEVTREEYP